MSRSRALATLLVSAGAVAVCTPAAATPSASPAAAVTLVDDTGLLSIDVPGEWDDIVTSPGESDSGERFGQIVASPDIDALLAGYDTPGVIYDELAYQPDSAAALSATYQFGDDCTAGAIVPYTDSYFTGSLQAWEQCGATEARIVTLVASPYDRGFSVGLLAQIPSAAETASLHTLFRTFYVVAPTTTRVSDAADELRISTPLDWTFVDDAGPGLVVSSAAVDFGSAPAVRLQFADGGVAPPLSGDEFPSCSPGAVAPFERDTWTGWRLELTGCAGDLRVVLVSATDSTQPGRPIVLSAITAGDDDATADLLVDSFEVATPSMTEAMQESGETVTPPGTTPASSAPPTASPEAAPTGSTQAPSTTAAAGAVDPSSFVTVADDSGVIAVDLPPNWVVEQTGERPAVTQGIAPYEIVASPSGRYGTIDDVSGVAVTVFNAQDAAGLLAINDPGCSAVGEPMPFATASLSGLRRDYADCGGSGRRVIHVAVGPADGSFTIIAAVSIGPDETAIGETILGSLTDLGGLAVYRLVDDTGRVTARFPASWGTHWTSVDDSPAGDAIVLAASPDADAEQPNLAFVRLADYVEPTSYLLANRSFDEFCDYGGVEPYAANGLTGVRESWVQCEGVPFVSLVTIAAAPADRSVLVVAGLDLATDFPGVAEVLLPSVALVEPAAEAA